MSTHRIARATAKSDFVLEIEWTDGECSHIDFKTEIAKGGVMADLAEPVIFTERLFVHSQGESLGWEVFGRLIDFEADNLWRDAQADKSAAE